MTIYRPSVVAPTYNWNFGIQTKLPAKTLLDLNNVSTQGRHLLRQVNINAVDPGTQFRNSSLNQNAIRPYSGYTNITLWESSAASNYNGLQASVSRRYASSPTYSVAYTFSKVLTDASDKNGAREDPNNYRRDRSHATFDRNHVFVASYVYKLPFFAHGAGLANRIAGGGEFSGITQMQAGQWLSPNISTPTGTRRPDRVGDVQYLDPRAIRTLTGGNNQQNHV